jgi:formate-dependent nitrite reductase membrane component NrfD
MTFERWNYLAGLLFMAAVAAYQFRAASMTDDTAKETRMRMSAWVAVVLAVLALYGFIFDPETRYSR